MKRTTYLTIIIVTFLVMSALPALSAEQGTELPVSPDLLIETAPVVIDGVPLFQVRGIQAFPAKKRAEEIAKRIRAIAKDPDVNVDSIVAEDSKLATNIVADGQHLISIFDIDASIEGVPRAVMAQAYVSKIKSAVVKYRRDRTAESIIKGILHSLLTTAVLIAVLILLFKLFRKLNSVIESRYRRKIETIKIQSLEIVQAKRIWAMVTGLTRIIRLIIILTLVYLYLDFVLSRFPWTRFAAFHLLEYVVSPLKTIGGGILGYIPNLIFITILIFVTRYALKFTKLFFSGVEAGTIKISGFETDWAKPTYKIVRFVVIIFAVVVSYPYIPGSESDAFKGLSIFIGVIFSLGSSSAISNIIAGYIMTYRRAFRLGDRVKIGDFTGDVIEMRLQVTHLRTVKNEEIIVPNSLILNSHVINYSSLARDKGLILHTNVTIGYDVPWRQVNGLLLMAADRTTGVLKEPKPFVFQKSLDDFYITYELNAYTDDPHRMNQTYSDLHKHIVDAFNAYGVQIMSPNYEIDPDRPKVVPKEKWFEPPARKEE